MFPYAVVVTLGACSPIFCSDFTINSMFILPLLPIIGRFLRVRSCCTLTLILAYLLSFAWTNFVIQLRQNQALPVEWEGKLIDCVGEISSIPQLKPYGTRFLFKPHTILAHPKKRLGSFQLTWAHPPQKLQTGQVWHLRLRLKRPKAMQNPGGIDQERMLFYQGIVAKGQVKNKHKNKLLYQKLSWLAALRATTAKQIDHVIHQDAIAGVLKALTIGVRDEISSVHWQCFQTTGTLHLMAISGLHIGFAAFCGYGMVQWLCRRGRQFHWFTWPSLHLAHLGGWLMALFYTLLSGAGLPALRAVIMLSVASIARCCYLPVQIGQCWSVAVIIVLLLDPLAPMSYGFWLSFCAVGILILGQGCKNSIKQRWLACVAVGWGLVPLTLYCFGEVNLLSPLINFCFIPLMSVLVIMPAIMTVLLCAIGPVFFTWLWMPVGGLLKILLMLLVWMDHLTWMIQASSLHGVAMMILVFGGVCLGLPLGLRQLYPGVLCLMPAFYPKLLQIKPGDYQLTVLDVGQGLCVIVKTRHHTCMIDTGPPNAMQAISGYLKASQIRRLDHLLISHADLDHAGNLNGLLGQIEIKKITTSMPKLVHSMAQRCHQGQRWQWDGVLFEVLAPNAYAPISRHNNNSCVLRIQGRYRSLLPGDIDSVTEQTLISQFPQLQSDVLVVPHHGSRTSSSALFLAHVAPKWAAISADHLNRYGHPHPEVVRRYHHGSIKLDSTVNCGAIRYRYNTKKEHVERECYRMDHRKNWFQF